MKAERGQEARGQTGVDEERTAGETLLARETVLRHRGVVVRLAVCGSRESVGEGERQEGNKPSDRFSGTSSIALGLSLITCSARRRGRVGVGAVAAAGGFDAVSESGGPSLTPATELLEKARTRDEVERSRVGASTAMRM
jgi:hypothetical protein